MTLKEACQKLNLSEEAAMRMIAIDHEKEFLYSKKDTSSLVSLEIEPLDKEVEKYLRKIIKTLRISWDSAICGLLLNYIDSEKILKKAPIKKRQGLDSKNSK